jgi:hypothetical protein
MLKRMKGKFLRWWSKPVRPLLLLLPTLAASVLVVAGSTLAWYISNDNRENKLETGKQRFNVAAYDDFAQPLVPPDPGDSFSKTVSATNTADIPGFVRLLVEPIIFGDALIGTTPLPSGIGAEVLLNIDAANWRLGEDGYYYYLHVLFPGQTAPPLFTTVALANGLGNEYRNADMRIEVKAEGVDYYMPHYRDAWWEVPVASLPSSLSAVDAVLAGLAVPP